jgi:flagellin-like hook-associated protein FlgL
VAGLADIVSEQTFALEGLLAAGGFSCESDGSQRRAGGGRGATTAVAIIGEPLRGQLAGPLESIRASGDVISLTQGLESTLAGISLRLDKMKELAGDADNGNHSANKIAPLREQLRSLGEEINDITKQSEFKGNKLFGRTGQSMVVGPGGGMVLEIRARDFSFDLDNDNVGGNFKNLRAKIKKDIDSVLEYEDFLVSVREQAEQITSTMLDKFNDIMEFNSYVVQQRESLEVNAFTIARVLKDAAKAMRGQANVAGPRAVQLLRDKSKPGFPK